MTNRPFAVYGALTLLSAAVLAFCVGAVPYVLANTNTSDAPHTPSERTERPTVVAKTPVDSDGDGETDYYCVDNVDCGNDVPAESPSPIETTMANGDR